MTVIYGQEDYVERLRCYLDESAKKGNMKFVTFPVNAIDPNNITFDFGEKDAELREISPDCPFIVAFTSKFQPFAQKYLNDKGFFNLLLYDPNVDNKLKRDFVRNKFKNFVFIDDDKKITIYLVKSVFDKSVKTNEAATSPYIKTIQVGAALTSERISAITDDTGDNISVRNRHFSEMTAFYWLWKNAADDFIGICHYRRIWKNLDLIVQKLQRNDIDVILPVPTLSLPTVRENYFPRFIPQVGEVFLNVLTEMTPQYAEVAKEFFADNVYYACNMCILRRAVIDDLCSWMFPIVFEIENRVGDLSDPYYNRYCGFCTELLITLYFRANRQNWRIVHADKIFIG